jgi:adenylate cyclase
MAQASGLCEQALQIDKNNVRALVVLAIRRLALLYNWQRIDPQADRLAADDLISRALAIDSNNYFAHYGRSQFLAPQRPDEAIVEAERALALNPSFLPAYISLWVADWTAGRTEKADQYLMRRCGSVPTTLLPTYFLERRGTDCSTSHATKRRLSFSNARLPWRPRP